MKKEAGGADQPQGMSNGDKKTDVHAAAYNAGDPAESPTASEGEEYTMSGQTAETEVGVAMESAGDALKQNVSNGGKSAVEAGAEAATKVVSPNW